MIFSKMKRFMARFSSKRYVQYLRSKGAVIGEYTEFLSPIHSEVDIGRAKYISIGDHCILCSGISIIAHDYSWKVLEDAYGEELPSGGMPIHIGNNVFIGYGSVILPETFIGDNVIIGAGSIVRGKVDSNSVVVGNPAKKVCSYSEYIDKNRQLLNEGYISENGITSEVIAMMDEKRIFVE